MEHTRNIGHLAEQSREDDGGREAVAVILGGITVIVVGALVVGVVMLVRSLLS